MIPECTNNEKGELIRDLLKENDIPFNSLGSGTNRLGLQIDGYAVKIALDKDGMIDNCREMKYSRALQPYVVKVYECVPNGLIAVTEYINIFTLDDFHLHRKEIKEILEDISNYFLIGDVGFTSKNYLNWGFRRNGTVCILDFAYIYSTRFNTFKCNCEDESILRYDSNFVNLVCPTCGKKYRFDEIRRRITKKQQADEIGDVRTMGYNLTEEEEEVEYNPEFEAQVKKKKEKKYTAWDKIKDYKEKYPEQDWD